MALNAPPLSIASLRSLHERVPTLYERQAWARKYLGIKNLDALICPASRGPHIGGS